MRDSRNQWIVSGVDAVGLLVAAFLAVIVDELVSTAYSLFIEISEGLILVALIILLMSKFWTAKARFLRRGVFRGASWAVGLLAGIGVKMVWSMSWPAGVVSAAILLLVVIWVVRQQRWASNRLSRGSETTEANVATSATWFREEDLELFSTSWVVLMSVLGGLVGFLTAAFLLLYVGVFSDWFFVGVVVGVVAFGLLGALRNRIVKKVASRGFPAAYNLQRVGFLFYAGSIVSGAVGIQEPNQVLPYATIFIVLLYMFLLWSLLLKRRELGRLFIFQFLLARDRDGIGYSWLQKGLRIIGGKLQTLGISVKRNRLYFGCSYSLFEGADFETDLDKIYLLGDWSSKPREQNGLHQVTSWFLYRSVLAETEGFRTALPMIDYFLDALATRNLAAVAALGGLAGALVTIVVGAVQLLQYLRILH